MAIAGGTAARAVALTVLWMFLGPNGVVARTNCIIALPVRTVDGNTSDNHQAKATMDDLMADLSRSGTALAYGGEPANPRKPSSELFPFRMLAETAGEESQQPGV